MEHTEITVWHGGQHEDPRWFSTDADHSAYFGELRQYRVSGRAVRLDAETDERLADLDGYEADEVLFGILAETGAELLIIAGWEGSGLTVLVDAYATIEEIG